MDIIFLSTLINGGEGAKEAAEQATQATGEAATGGIFNSVSFMVIYVIVLIAIFYFLAIRPQKKRQKQMEDLQTTIKNGDWVILDSGFYGKVAGISDQVYTIEFGTNKSVLIPVSKDRIIGKGEPNFNAVKPE